MLTRSSIPRLSSIHEFIPELTCFYLPLRTRWSSEVTWEHAVERWYLELELELTRESRSSSNSPRSSVECSCACTGACSFPVEL